MAINNVSGNTLLQSGFFPPVRVASTGSPLTPSTGGLLTVDGITLVAGDRVLCKDETSAVNNGIYAANTGPWTRTADASTNQQFFSGMAVIAALGIINAKSIFVCTCTDDPVVVGTSLITFAAQLPVGAGNVVGPGSSTTGYVATFANTTGELLSATSTTGTGQAVLADSPSLTTPSLDSATAVSINKLAITSPANGATLTISNSATFAVTNSLTLSAVSGTTVTFNASLTFSGAASKTLTVNNSLAFSGTDNTTFTFPGATDTVVGVTAVQTLVNKTLSGVTATNVTITGGTVSGVTASTITFAGGTIDSAVIGGNTPAAGTFTTLSATTSLFFGPPTSLTGTTGTVISTFTLISASGGFTATLPAPTANNGRVLWILNQVAQTVNSISANIVPTTTSTAVSSLLANTAGKWCMLVANSASNVWQTMMAN